MGGAVEAAAGPVLGGLLSLASWRLTFLINIPIGVIAFILLAKSLHAPRYDASFDWIGQVTAILAVAASPTEPSRPAPPASPPSSHRVLHRRHCRAGRFHRRAGPCHPMMPLDLFTSRTFNVCVAIGFAFMIGFYGVPFLFSLYFQQIRGMSSREPAWRSCR